VKNPRNARPPLITQISTDKINFNLC